MGFGGIMGQKLGGKIPKLEDKTLSPKDIHTFLDSKFDVEFNFGINHDIIPWSD